MSIEAGLRKTPFYDIHIKLGAKMVSFAGFIMPLMYRSIMEEHRRVRTSVGLFDLTHMGEFEISGPEATDFVQKMTTNDVKRLEVMQIQYTTMCYENGGIVDDLLVYRLPDKFMLVVNAANIKKDFSHLQTHLPHRGVELKDSSYQTALLAIQGPRAEEVFAKMTDYDLSKLRFYWSGYGVVCGERILFSRTGYTGEDGFELYFPNELAPRFWERAMEAGREFEVEPIGLGARDSLRMEMKYALYGNDIDRTTTPLEAGLGWIVKLDADDFLGKQALLKQKEEGIKRKLVAFDLKERGIPRQHCKILKDGRQIGEVTSGMFSPSLGIGIGLGYVQIEFSKIGENLEIDIRGKKVPAEIVKPPFWKKGSHK
jgi:aminomethyltransferase